MVNMLSIRLFNHSSFGGVQLNSGMFSSKPLLHADLSIISSVRNVCAEFNIDKKELQGKSLLF